MTPRSFFTILIKLFGVYLIWETFAVFFSLLPTLQLVVQAGHTEDVYLTLVMLTLVVGSLVLIIRQCLYKPAWIIEKLSLDQGFAEEKFDITPQRTTVLSVAVIITGMMLLVSSLPVLCQQFLVYVQQMNASGPDTKGYLALHGLKSLAGYLMVTNNQRIVAAIEKGSQNKPS